ncbi:Disease resistance protein (TIR-NBS-LRR class) family [Arabidopsis thaliana]|uniref:ADP-ribosyl cyclase/cyclic ADP-ribose hydrolase n=1 Tax=Arabidopsis thaliana TaxID=3702 RepID=F4I9F1_ARATH|nr:Disease resistance protein (TIR-NBS-LRR class) family [Arabidopsis thaliana]AEE31370.1 Disease resistance protein (TIR-NBS-LRR class) family [Arabidopsis thaliana]|eukprot:NP_001117396.1 Disease resistance protein (TIR-NBS-LRR class) family [Arabidopsis thaliana]
MASSSSSHNWLYDVFLSFRGEDVRVTFRSHFLKELDRKLITAFRDNEIERSHSLWPDLEQAIKESRIAVVVFSKNYASSSWCLNELLEIVNCNDKIVIPVFYHVDPSQVRHQIGDFGKIFENTCKRQTDEEVKNQWKKALTLVANMLGFDSAKWNDEAKMIEEIANDVLGKLLLTTPKDSEELVGIEDHIAEMSLLLQLESKEVRMVGISGSSGIGKTTIARALFKRLSRHFQGSTFIDRAFVSYSRNIYSGANPDDPNMKLQLQGHFLSEILGKKDIKIDDPAALEERLKHQKVLIIIDDLDDIMVLDTLVGQTQWFGYGSRIIVVTNDKHFLIAHGIDHIYEVSFPTDVHACQMLCQSAFKQNYAPKGFEDLVVDVVRHAGNFPLGLNLLGKYLRRRDMEYWMDMLPRLENSLRIDGKIEKILRISYDGLESEDQEIFRHIACLFNHMEVTTIKSLLADSDVSFALENLADKSLIHVRQGYVVMHRSLQEMGRKIVRIQSIDKPGEREFLVDPNDIHDILNACTGTQKVLGISLDIRNIRELDVHERAFKGMSNLRFLEIKNFGLKEDGLHLPPSFDYLPRTLKLLCWSKFPMRCMPFGFRPENLVKLEMQYSKLHKLWEGVAPLTCLKEMDLHGSSNLKVIPDLSEATNLEILNLKFCESLVELPSSIRNLNKLLNLDMLNCKSLKILPTGFNLKSLDRLNLYHCSKLKTFPKFSTNISVLNLNLTNIEDFPSNLHLENLVEFRISKEESDEKQWEEEKPLTPFLAMMLSPTLTSLHLENLPSLVELTSSFQNLNQLKDLIIINCINLETLPTGINLQSLDYLCFSGCSQLRSFPEISTNISVLYLDETAIEEVPWWIEKFSNLTELSMNSCSRLKCVFLHMSKLKHLKEALFRNCGTLTRVELSGYPSGMEVMKADNIDTASSSLPKVVLSFLDCFNLDPETVLHHQESIIFNYMLFTGKEEVPSYFTYRTTGSSSLTIPILHVHLSQPFFRFRIGALVTNKEEPVELEVKCEFKDRFGNNFDYDIYFEVNKDRYYGEDCYNIAILDCRIPLNEDNAALAQRNYYDHVDIKIEQLDKRYSDIEQWGIRLLEDCSSAETRLDNYSNSTLPHVSEAEEGNKGYTPLQGLVNEIEHSEEPGDINVETERSTKRMRLYHFI